MSEIISKEVKDPRLHSVTVTAVKISDDLRKRENLFCGNGKG